MTNGSHNDLRVSLIGEYRPPAPESLVEKCRRRLARFIGRHPHPVSAETVRKVQFSRDVGSR